RRGPPPGCTTARGGRARRRTTPRADLRSRGREVMTALTQHAETVVAELRATLARVDDGEFEAVASVLADAPRVFVLGVGREGLAARGFAMRLMHTGTTVHWGWDDTTPNVTADDVVVIVNGSGAIGHLDYVFGE